MDNYFAIELIQALAWPLLAALALLYIWRSDAIGKLLRISDAVDRLKSKLNDIIEAEQRLSKSSGQFGDIATKIERFHSSLVEIKNDVESIRDEIDRPRQPSEPPLENRCGNSTDHEAAFMEMNEAWEELVNTIREKIDWIDGRMVGSEAYRLAHGNRRGPRLDYEQADQIGILHSAIKSYRRRRDSADSWLTREMVEEFITETRGLNLAISKL